MKLDDLMEASNSFVVNRLFGLVDEYEELLIHCAESEEDRDAVSIDLDTFINFGLRLRTLGWSSDELLTLLGDVFDDVGEPEKRVVN